MVSYLSAVSQFSKFPGRKTEPESLSAIERMYLKYYSEILPFSLISFPASQLNVIMRFLSSYSISSASAAVAWSTPIPLVNGGTRGRSSKAMT